MEEEEGMSAAQMIAANESGMTEEELSNLTYAFQAADMDGGGAIDEDEFTLLHLAVHQVSQVKFAAHVVLHLPLVLLGHDATHCAFHRSRNVVDILRLYDGPQPVLKDFCEVVL